MLPLRWLLLAMLGLAACSGRDKGDPRFLLEKRPIAGLPYHGYRSDIPEARRGDATFARAAFSREGDYLVTLGAGGMRVYDGATGAFRRALPLTLDGNDLIMLSGAHHRVLARRGDVAPNMPEARGLGIWDLDDGRLIGMIPETERDAAVPLGFTGEGEPVVLRDGRVEVWRADGQLPRLTIPPPPGERFCIRGGGSHATYQDKGCWELSPSGRRLALTARLDEDYRAPLRPYLADLATGALDSIPLPDSVGRDGVSSFAFGQDEGTLALGLREGLFLRTADGGGRFVPGAQQRANFLVPMAFTDHDRRIVALGDQLQVSTYDAATGELVGREAPPFEDWEGVLRISADGSRAVAYRFGSDILVVIDGASGTRHNYLCPYFCNRYHNPVEVPYAVSPDGRRVATGGRLGAGLWDTDADTLIAPLRLR